MLAAALAAAAAVVAVLAAAAVVALVAVVDAVAAVVVGLAAVVAPAAVVAADAAAAGGLAVVTDCCRQLFLAVAAAANCLRSGSERVSLLLVVSKACLLHAVAKCALHRHDSRQVFGLSAAAQETILYWITCESPVRQHEHDKTVLLEGLSHAIYMIHR